MQKQYRLKSQRSYSLIYRKGESVSDNLMVLLFLKSRFDNVKVGFSVSKKIGNSVTRNKVKRRLREIVRELIPRIKSSYSYIIIAKPGIETAEFQKIRENVVTLFEKSKKLVSI